MGGYNSHLVQGYESEVPKRSLHSNAEGIVTNYTAKRTLFWSPYPAAMGKKKKK